MKNKIYLLLVLALVISCNESTIQEEGKVNQLPSTKSTLKSSVVSPLENWETHYISEMVTDGRQLTIGYISGHQKTIDLNNANQVVPVTLSNYNLRSKQLSETRLGDVRTRSAEPETNTIQLPDSLKTLRAVRAGDYVVATGLYSAGKYMLFDMQDQSVSYHLSYPEHPAYPEIGENTKAILYASTVLKIRPDNQAFVCGDMYSGNIEFCRITNGRIEQIASYCYHHPKVYITEGENPNVAYSRDNRFGFTDICVSEDRVYAIYSGRIYRNNEQTFQQCRTLLEYNWEGRLLNSYDLDVSLNNIAYNQVENAIYAIGADPETSLFRISIAE